MWIALKLYMDHDRLWWRWNNENNKKGTKSSLGISFGHIKEKREGVIYLAISKQIGFKLCSICVSNGVEDDFEGVTLFYFLCNGDEF
jgi:hypothetical protein